MYPETWRKLFVRFLVASALAIHLGAFAPSTRADGEVEGSIVSVDDSQFPVVTAIVDVGVGGRPLTELTASRIAVRESGAVAREVQVKSVLDASLPLQLVVVVDTSGSMAGIPLAQARAAAESLIGSLQPQDYVAVVSFATAVTVEQTATQDHVKAITAVKGLQAGGNTALYEAVVQSAILASQAAVPRRAVVLLTDGENFGATTGASRQGSIAAAATANGLPFYTVGVGATVDAAYLSELVAKTGGRTFQASGAEQISQVYESIQVLLRSQLVVRFVSTADAAAASRSVDIAVSDTLSGAGGAFHRDYQSRRAAASVTASPALSPVTPRPAESPGASSTVTSTTKDEGEASSLLWLPLLVFVGLAASGTVLYFQRARQKKQRSGLVDGGSTAWPPRERGVVAPGRSSVRLFALGSATEEGPQLIEVSAVPMTLGSSPDCDVRLPAAEGVGAMHARLWLKDGTAVVHHLAPDTLTVVDGGPIEWASLRSGSILRIGPYQYQVAGD